ncbi:MAG: class I SAM-dependent methyltransferase, partial [Deltaproteobacteria bacterium]|nr:class I SAM-dependent methyltransferase [Deltaproteobacteria bacterium]
SEIYDIGWVQQLAYRPVHDAVLDALRQRPRSAILDLGCGTGLFTRRIREELRDTRVVGCDFSSGMLQRASRTHAEVEWVRGNALELPFAEECFDTVISTEAFHWFAHPREAIAEIHRALAPGPVGNCCSPSSTRPRRSSPKWPALALACSAIRCSGPLDTDSEIGSSRRTFRSSFKTASVACRGDVFFLRC